MAVRDGAPFLDEAIQSVLRQTLRDFELVIINDGSVDSTLHIIRSYSDRRIRVVDNPVSLGLAACLNLGIENSRGRYIARMDADDVCLPERLEKQVAFMEAHPVLCASGTWATLIDAEGAVLRERRMPCGDAMQVKPWLTSPIIHPSAMIRRRQLGEIRYNPKLTAAQDFDLWFRLARSGRLDNLPEPLLRYRIHNKSISQGRRAEQTRISYQIFLKYTGISSISYDEYLCLIYCSFRLSPIQHLVATRRLAKGGGFRYRHLIMDSLFYSRLWLRHGGPDS